MYYYSAYLSNADIRTWGQIPSHTHPGEERNWSLNITPLSAFMRQLDITAITVVSFSDKIYNTKTEKC